MSLPLWFRIVRDYPERTKGPTLPFLIGALRGDPDAIVPDSTSKAEVRNLISAMRSEMPHGWGVALEWCGGKVDAHIFDARMGGQGFTHDGVYGHDVHDDESLVEALWAEYGDKISSRTYSGEKTTPDAKTTWRGFDDKERANIKLLREAK